MDTNKILEKLLRSAHEYYALNEHAPDITTPLPSDPEVQTIIDSTERLASDWHGTADTGRFTFPNGLIIITGSPPQWKRDVLNRAKELGILINGYEALNHFLSDKPSKPEIAEFKVRKIKEYAITVYLENDQEIVDLMRMHDPHLECAIISVNRVDAVVESVELEEKKEAPEDLSDKHVIVFDRGGLYTYFAQKLGEEFGQVDYYIPDEDAYPTSTKATIGKGLPEIRRIDDKEYYKILDKVDLIAFPDCYDGSYVAWLRSKGYRVFGGGLSEKFEIDKKYFLDALERLGLLTPKTEMTTGIKALLDYLEDHKPPLWLKGLKRGDFETKEYTGFKQFENWLRQDLMPRIGQKARDIKVLVQEGIKADCEPGLDRFVADGVYTQGGCIGYEIKDKGLVGCFFDTPPKVMTDIDDKTAGELSDCRCHYSTEIRINKDGAYLIDPTIRVPSPPGELITEWFVDYPRIIWDISGGNVPVLKAHAKYGVEIILTSLFYENHQICVEFPKEFAQYIKLKNQTRHGGVHYCIPNGNGAFFGAVVAWDDDWKKAAEKVKEILDSIECEELEAHVMAFDEAEKAIAAGEDYGIKF